MKRFCLLIVTLLLALGLIVLGWRAWHQTSPSIILLSDGSRIEFRAVTSGTNGKFDYGPPWQRLAARIRGKLGRKYGGKSIVNAGYDSRTEAVFWFVRRGGRLQTNTVTSMSFNPLGQIMQNGQLLKRGTPTPVVSVVPAVGLRVNVRDEQGEANQATTH